MTLSLFRTLTLLAALQQQLLLLLLPLPHISLPSVAQAECAQPTALYSIFFDFTWTAETDPNFPPTDVQHPPAFLELLCVCHRTNYTLWRPGERLPPQSREWVHRGMKPSAIDSLIFHISYYSVNNISVLSYGRGTPRVTRPDGRAQIYLPFRAAGNFSRLSCVSRLRPSADWFVGISHIDLCASGTWSPVVVEPLPAWDAGLFRSDTYQVDPASVPDPEPEPRAVSIAKGNGAREYGSVTITKAATDRPIPPQRETPPEQGVCIATRHLRALRRVNGLVFPRHRLAHVLCDHAGSCATPTHFVRWVGLALTMREYCEEVSCRPAVLFVNSPRYRPGLRVASYTPGLEFLSHAVRFNSRIERALLRVVVAMGG